MDNNKKPSAIELIMENALLGSCLAQAMLDDYAEVIAKLDSSASREEVKSRVTSQCRLILSKKREQFDHASGVVK